MAAVQAADPASNNNNDDHNDNDNNDHNDNDDNVGETSDPFQDDTLDALPADHSASSLMAPPPPYNDNPSLSTRLSTWWGSTMRNWRESGSSDERQPLLAAAPSSPSAINRVNDIENSLAETRRPSIARRIGYVFLAILALLLLLIVLFAQPFHTPVSPPPPSSDVPPPPFPSNGLRILSYNFFLRPPPVHSPYQDFKSTRLDLFASHLHNYDVLCLTEVFGDYNSRRSTLIDHARAAGLGYFAIGPERSWLRGKFVGSGVLILSRYPIQSVYTEEYPDAYGVDRVAAKGFVSVKLSFSPNNNNTENAHGERQVVSMRIITTHLQASYIPPDLDSGDDVSGPGAVTRHAQLLQLESYLQTLPSTDPWIVAGDLNVPGSRGAPLPPRIHHHSFDSNANDEDNEGESESGKEYLRMMQVLHHPRDILYECCGHRETWREWGECVEPPGLEGHKGKRLDYILIGQSKSPKLGSKSPTRGYDSPTSGGSTSMKKHNGIYEPPTLKVRNVSVVPFTLDPDLARRVGVRQLSDHSGVEAVLEYRFT
ncbi:Sphingomyelin phosphodiesterase 2, neutral membrane (Neutral sphingomyelinase) [Gaertneriomyces sp. JEL0708]|nr:Sphingomyelin phosphodiesterase 2, neutral membrane (Neutral sphingomyelinase) [Gaertneriomyces sp. JEL0708]